MSLILQPLTGTVIDWKEKTEQTNVHVTALAGWIIHEDSSSLNKTGAANQTVLAFNSILDLDLALSLGINATSKQVKLNIDSMKLTGFNVTQDNLGGGVKKDE